MTDGVVARVEQALGRLEDALRSTGHPLLDLLQPGLSDQHIAEAMAPTGLTLPDEAAAVWRWRNGLRSDAHDPDAVPGSTELPGWCTLLDLRTAVDTYMGNLATFPWGQRDDLSRDWFPFASFSGGVIWVDRRDDPSAPARLISRYTSDYNPPEELAARSVPSVARGVEVWAALLERGIWTVVGPGDTITVGGQRLVLGDTTRRHWDFAREREPDLPPHWPC